nr:hypothetical protein [uncultured Sphingomonas sp.]
MEIETFYISSADVLPLGTSDDRHAVRTDVAAVWPWFAIVAEILVFLNHHADVRIDSERYGASLFVGPQAIGDNGRSDRERAVLVAPKLRCDRSHEFCGIIDPSIPQAIIDDELGFSVLAQVAPNGPRAGSRVFYAMNVALAGADEGVKFVSLYRSQVRSRISFDLAIAMSPASRKSFATVLLLTPNMRSQARCELPSDSAFNMLTRGSRLSRFIQRTPRR